MPSESHASDQDLVLVTGGTGYIATFVIAQLLERGCRVRTTVRTPARRNAVHEALDQLCGAVPKELEICVATLDRDRGWADAVAGCRYVIHVASPLPSSSTDDDDDLIRPARDGALRVLNAARDAGVERVVMTSSVGAIAYGHGTYEVPKTEADWSDLSHPEDMEPYERSKTLAEQAAWEWRRREGGATELATICPGAVLGPVFSHDFSDSIEIVRGLLSGRLPGYPRFGWALVDVRDIADLHVRAMTNPDAADQRYIGAVGFTTMADIARIIREEFPDLRSRVPRFALPNWLVRIGSRTNPVVQRRLFDLGKKRPVSADKACRDLGWSPRENEVSIIDTVRSLLEHGLVRDNP